jgi:hypothetical protein
MPPNPPPPESSLFIPKIVSKPLRPGHSIKIGNFAGIHGDEEVGTQATQELIRWAAEKPDELHFYPVCNPTGLALGTRHSHSGHDLNCEFWHGSTETEVVYLEGELSREKYDGIVFPHSDDTSDGCYGFVSGALLSEHLLEPALQASSQFLPRNIALVIDGFPASRGITGSSVVMLSKGRAYIQLARVASARPCQLEGANRVHKAGRCRSTPQAACRKSLILIMSYLHRVHRRRHHRMETRPCLAGVEFSTIRHS